MRSLRGTMVSLAAALCTMGLGELAEMGCGDDTSGAPITTGTDATADGSDAGSTGSNDGARAEASDAMPEDVAVDGAPVGLTVAIDEATAECTRWLDCCPGRVDSGTYDLQNCIHDIKTFGWEGTLPRDTRVYSRGHVIVNQAKAASCISAINSFPCGMQTPARWGAITSACELVIEGTIPSNSPGCISSFECESGNYCDSTIDGGMCTPLATRGQPCNTKVGDPNLEPPLADQMCSYLSSGQPALFCDLITNGPDAATCQPLRPNGASCSNPTNMYYDDQACVAPALCGDNLECGGTTTYPYSDFCQYYRIPDAGGPG